MQQTIMEIIQTLRHNSTPETAQYLFKTLSETSELIEKKIQVEDTKSKDGEQEDKKDKKEPSISLEDQLQLLLSNLGANDKLKKVTSNLSSAQAFSATDSESRGGGGSVQTGGGKQSSSGYTSGQGNYQLITHAYHLINEVIMYPQIMWTRNFFYSLGAMAPHQQ